MRFRATARGALGLYFAGTIVAAGLCAAGVTSQTMPAQWLLAAVAVVGLLVTIRIRYQVLLSEDELQCRTLLREHSVKWDDIVRVSRAVDSGYWAARLFGPAVLDFESRRSTTRINFKLFSVECLEEVLRRVPAAAKLTV